MTAKEKLAALADRLVRAAFDFHARGITMHKTGVTFEIMAKTLPEHMCEEFLNSLGDIEAAIAKFEEHFSKAKAAIPNAPGGRS